jgi:HD-like signal output (HDOD) protein
VAALLHDIGKLVIGRHLAPGDSGELLEARDEAGRRDAIAERDLLGLDHALVGARVARAWRLPGGIPEAIAFHHRPESAPTEKTRNLASMVQLANSVAHHLGIGGPEDGPTRMTTDCVARLRLSREDFDELCRGTEEELSIVLDLYR